MCRLVSLQQWPAVAFIRATYRINVKRLNGAWLQHQVYRKTRENCQKNLYYYAKDIAFLSCTQIFEGFKKIRETAEDDQHEHPSASKTDENV